MKIKKVLLFLWLFCFFGSSAFAQEGKLLSIKKAVQLALDSSNQSMIAKLKVEEADKQLKIIKTTQYPNLKLSGQYQYLNNADVDIKISKGNKGKNGGSEPSPEVHQLWLAQAAVSIPLFSGFKIRNTVKAEKISYQATELNSKNDREKIAAHVIQDYINLYKASNAIKIIQENLKSAQQRVKDFTAMEKNELLPKNDVLKANLQEAKVEIELENAKKSASMLNFQLVLELKLPLNTHIETVDADLSQNHLIENQTNFNRLDLESMRLMEQKSEHQIKIARSQYYPSLALTGGYANLNVENVVAVNNAMNIGLSFSYNLAGLFQAKYKVQLAKKQTEEIQYQLNILENKIKIEVENAKQEHQLAEKKLAVYTKSEQQAIENYRIIKDKYKNDLADINDLIEADAEQLNAKINKANANAELTQKYYDLMQAEGNLIEKLNL